MKVIAQGDPIEYDVIDAADACKMYRTDMTNALIGVVTKATDYERAHMFAAQAIEAQRIYKALVDWHDAGDFDDLAGLFRIIAKARMALQ